MGHHTRRRDRRVGRGTGLLARLPRDACGRVAGSVAQSAGRLAWSGRVAGLTSCRTRCMARRGGGRGDRLAALPAGHGG